LIAYPWSWHGKTSAIGSEDIINEKFTARKYLPVNNSLIAFPVKRDDKTSVITSGIINEKFTARSLPKKRNW
jgi:hypothetical protein